MSNRSAAIIITILAVLLCGCPGLAGLCWGLISLLDYAVGTGYIASNQTTYLYNIIGGICGGVIFIAIAVVVGILVLRKKKEVPPPTPEESIPPAV